MRRAPIAALVLLALALVATLAWITGREMAFRAAPPPAAELLAKDASTLAPELEGAHATRTSLGAAPAVLPAGEPRATPAGFVGPPAASAPRTRATVFVELRAAGTGRPLHAALVTLRFGDKAQPAVQRLRESAPGEYALELPVGTALVDLQAQPAPDALPGPSTAENAEQRFEPLTAMLDRTLGEDDLVLDFEAREGGELRGRVLEAGTGVPLADAELWISSSWHAPVRFAPRDDGSFVCGLPAPGSLLGATSPGHCPILRELTPERFVPGAPELLLELERGLHVAGRVLDARREPLAGVSIALELDWIARPAIGQAPHASQQCVSAEDGTFCFRELPAAGRARLRAPLAGNSAYLGRALDLGPLEHDIDAVLLVQPDSVRVAVLASLADGRPLPPWGFELVCDGPHVETQAESRFLQDFTGLDESTALADPETFGRLLLVPTGTPLHLVALARPDPARPGRLAIGECTHTLLPSEAQPVLLRIVLDRVQDVDAPSSPGGSECVELGPEEAPSTIDLRILDAAGAPAAAGAMLEIDGPGIHARARLADGWLRLRALPGSGEWRIGLGAAREVLRLDFPLAGYGRVEHRLGAGR